MTLPADKLLLTEPMGYLDFLALEAHASLVLTDFGGIQEETTYLGVPCLTARQNTERPITVTIGSNRLVQKLRDTRVGCRGSKGSQEPIIGSIQARTLGRDGSTAHSGKATAGSAT